MPRRLARADLRPTEAGLDERRTTLVGAAIRVFAARGYHATTIEDVAREAGVAKGTVYWYFPSKKALFLAVLDHAAEAFRRELAARTRDEPSPARRLEAALRATLALAVRRPELYRLYFQRVVDADEEFVRERARIHARLLGDLRDTLRSAMAAGELAPGDPELLARMVMGAVEAAVGLAAEGRGGRGLGERAVAFILNGLQVTREAGSDGRG